jgi:hypothetical protein
MNSIRTSPKLVRRQRGALTILSAIIILFLLTVMLLYTTSGAVVDQRVSSNDYRSKVAFAMAEGVVDLTVEHMLAIGPSVASGTGWRAASGGKWVKCSASSSSPYCTTDLPSTEFGTFEGYFIHDLASVAPEVGQAIGNLTSNKPGATARVSLAMQFISDGGVAEGEPDPDEESDARAMFMVYGYGYADCTDTTDITTCQAETAIAKPLGNFRNLKGTPVVPLVAKSLVNGIGNMTIVGNPNSGGVGVPMSIWTNPANGSVSDGNGTWQTCEREEWYGTDSVPEDLVCPAGGGANACTCTQDEALSAGQAGDSFLGLDVLEDWNFPGDLFEFYFGVPRSDYELIKYAATILPDCSSLNENSGGLYWITGESCQVSSSAVIGSPEYPVLLISAAGNTHFNGGSTLFGILYVFDGEVGEYQATLSANGNNIIYGSVIVDGKVDKIDGTFDLIFADDLLDQVEGFNGFAAVDGGWRDFDVPPFTN